MVGAIQPAKKIRVYKCISCQSWLPYPGCFHKNCFPVEPAWVVDWVIGVQFQVNEEVAEIEIINVTKEGVLV